MSDPARNPFPDDADRAAMWEILMRRDFEAFLAEDWSMTGPDFAEAEFFGIDCSKIDDPDQWRLTFPDLATYQREWLRQAAEFKAIELRGVAKLEFLLSACELREIEISGGRAVAHKKFDGCVETITGEPVQLLWQTLYFLKNMAGTWKITGFCGYLPNPMARRS